MDCQPEDGLIFLCAVWQDNNFSLERCPFLSHYGSLNEKKFVNIVVCETVEELLNASVSLMEINSRAIL